MSSTLESARQIAEQLAGTDAAAIHPPRCAGAAPAGSLIVGTTKQPVGSPAHKALIEQARASKKCISSLLDEGSRDFEVLRALVEEYISYQSAADIVSGQS